MAQHQFRRNTGLLAALILLGAIYVGALSYLPTLSGSSMLDGIGGVVLGLYIGSRPAANLVDMLFLERGALHEMLAGWRGLGWLALNMLVMLVAFIVIVTGAMHLAIASLPAR